MYERFTDRARKVIALANMEAQRRNHEYIGAEHILLGLVTEHGGVAGNILSRHGVDLERTRLEVDRLVTPGPDMVTMGRLPQTPRAKKVIERAIQISGDLKCQEIGTEHLLLALIGVSDGVATQVLITLGVDLEGLAKEILYEIGAEAVTLTPGRDEKRLTDGPQTAVKAAGQFSFFANRLLALANQEAIRFNHEYVGTEHILLAITKEHACIAAKALQSFGLDLLAVRLDVEKHVTSGPDVVTLGRLPQTPLAKKAIEYALEESRRLNHNYVGTGHLLLGLMREQDGIAAQVLMNQGLKLEELREAVIALQGSVD